MIVLILLKKCITSQGSLRSMYFPYFFITLKSDSHVPIIYVLFIRNCDDTCEVTQKERDYMKRGNFVHLLPSYHFSHQRRETSIPIFPSKRIVGYVIVGYVASPTNCEVVKQGWLINHSDITTTPLASVSTDLFYL